MSKPRESAPEELVKRLEEFSGKRVANHPESLLDFPLKQYEAAQILEALSHPAADREDATLLADLKHGLMHIKEVCDSTKGYPDFAGIEHLIHRIDTALSSQPRERER